MSYFDFLSVPLNASHPLISQQQKRKYFVSPLFENALSEGDVKDHSMLWLRSIAKSSKKHDLSFLFHQVNEIKYKKNEYNPISILRCSILKELLDTIIDQNI